jgi:hypothetical protein
MFVSRNGSFRHWELVDPPGTLPAAVRQSVVAVYDFPAARSDLFAEFPEAPWILRGV